MTFWFKMPFVFSQNLVANVILFHFCRDFREGVLTNGTLKDGALTNNEGYLPLWAL